jgi:putative alpha-1,2-mannosidase
MSSLYVFLKLGFFPVAGQDLFIMHGSGYPRIEIRLPGGKVFSIVARNRTQNGFVKSVTLNGKKHDPFFLRYGEIMAGGELVFEYGEDAK